MLQIKIWPGKRFSTHGLKVSLSNEDLAYKQLKSGLDSQTISHINILSGHLLSLTQAHIVHWPNITFYGNLDIEYKWDFFVFVEYIHAGYEISKPLFATLYGSRYPPPPIFANPKFWKIL